jgi:hypothetical protein
MGEAEVDREEGVDVVEPAPVDEARGPAAPLLGRLEDQPDPPREARRARGELAGEADPDGGVPVVATGVHAALVDRREPLARGPVPGAGGLVPEQGVHVEAEGEGRAGSAELELADDAGGPPRPGEELLRRALGRGPRQLPLDRLGPRPRRRARAGGRVGAEVYAEAERLQRSRHDRGGAELGPARLGVRVEVPPVCHEQLVEALLVPGPSTHGSSLVRVAAS